MAQNIDQFRSNISNFARPTLFKVEIAGILDGMLEFTCKGANLPASTIGIIEVPYMGRKIKIPGDRTYAEWSLTIMNDSSMIIKKQLEDWQNSINDAELNVGPNQAFANMYDAKVKQLGTDGGILAEYQLFGCWPSEIAETELNFESSDTISEFTVQISYQYHKRTA